MSSGGNIIIYFFEHVLVKEWVFSKERVQCLFTREMLRQKFFPLLPHSDMSPNTSTLSSNKTGLFIPLWGRRFPASVEPSRQRRSFTYWMIWLSIQSSSIHDLSLPSRCKVTIWLLTSVCTLTLRSQICSFFPFLSLRIFFFLVRYTLPYLSTTVYQPRYTTRLHVLCFIVVAELKGHYNYLSVGVRRAGARKWP